ncbi:MAG TPA: hypothetical protein VK689_13085 [Armatimonadota bacterium]|nr:hypothetical protein [Armatimonadota bacterium]
MGVGTLDVGVAAGCGMVIVQAWWLDAVAGAGRARLAGADPADGRPHSA